MRYYKIVIGDSREKLKDIKSESVDFIITSPPYWYLVKFTDHIPTFVADLSRIQSRRDFFYELSKVWKECERVLKKGGYLLCEWEDIPIGSEVVGFPREYCIAGDMVDSVEKSGLYLIARWIWKKHKSGKGLMEKFWYTTYRNIQQGDPRPVCNWAYCFAFAKLTNSKKTKTLDFTVEEWINWVDGIWEIENPSAAAGGLSGGAVFPLELAKRFIKIYTRPKQVVLDPFLGTGTTMLTSYILGRSCIGIEVNKDMLPIIKQKVNFGQQDVTGEEIKWEVKE